MTQEKKEVSAKLERWENVGERGPPVAFVGRKAEINRAIAQLAAWEPGWAPGRTVVAQGAPGAGKTALLHEIGRRLPTVVPNATSLYLPTPWNDAAVPEVLGELATEMMHVPSDALRTTRSSETAAGLRALATARHAESQSMSPPEVDTWSAFRRQFKPLANRARPTLLLVDEIQRIGGGEATKDLLYHLHDQTTFPIVLVCGGLSTSSAHLRRLGLSRVADANVLRIDALTPAETEHCLDESLRMMAEDVGIDGHPDHWARRLAPATHGWPQHVTCHVRTAAASLRASGRLAFDNGNLASTLALAEAAMRDYYEQRLETSESHAMLVFAVHESIRQKPLRRTEAVAVVASVRPLLEPEDGDEHDRNFQHPRDCVQRMLRAGVIAYAGATTTSPLSIPIPSMAMHVAGTLSPDQRKNVRHALGLPAA